MPPRTGDAIHHQSSSVTSVEQEHGELIDMPAVRKALLRMVIALEENFHDREDLLQEAIVCFLSREQQYPGQRRRWYLQSVNFYLHHLRTSGRSLDSPKRRGAQAAFADGRDGWDQWRDILDIDEGIMSAVNAHDIFFLLVDRLEPIDRTILSALVDGLGVQDIAKQLKTSHQSVKRHRERIAALAIKLGVVPPRPW